MKEKIFDEFDTYPVYGPKVTGLLELLASIAARSNDEQSEISQETLDGNK